MALDTFPPKISDRFYMNWVLFNDNKNYVQEGLKVGSLKGYMYSDFNVNLLHFYPMGLSVYSILLYMHVSYQVFLSYFECS